jgi:hypothetical protein
MKTGKVQAGMITDPVVAAKVNDVMVGIAGQLDESVAFVMKRSSQEEFSRYRKAVGNVMGELLLEILNPLYKQHPGLKPPQLD